MKGDYNTPNTGQSYTITLKDVHINWGTHRNTATREPIEKEAYIPIPADIAYKYNILKGDKYNCVSSDDLLETILLASGNQSDPKFAKQLESYRDLKILGKWLHNICHAKAGDKIKVLWTSPKDMEITFISI